MPTQPQTIAGVERALDVLALFGERDVTDLGVTEIADRLELSKAVVHRILASCLVKEFVEVDDETRRYRLGPAILRLGLSYLDRVDVQDVARRALHELVRRTGETATLSVRAGWSRVYVDQVTPTRDIKMVVQLGSSHALHAGASSKALLAFLSDEEQATYLDGELAKVTQRTVTSKRKLREELAAIRDAGYAVSMGERQAGAGSVAAPLFDHTGRPVSVVSVCGPLERFEAEVDACAGALLEVTRETSALLGHRAA